MSASILVIDDSSTIRQLLHHCLTSAGMTVVTAQNGEEGVALFERASFDVVITDMYMPKLDGIGVIEKVRQGSLNRRVPILVLTTDNDREVRSRAQLAGATGWIVKPFEQQALVSLIGRITGTG
ncbi:response regulator [Rubellimicrobium rubrum]|uniref:Response regulator n=1 Tax=Rubellimicrobium rubrum TaxID=2585369 RepID=A0A5C4MJ29_9RHOB|nr:response regulator [Rubellimicrobium rubrum]TNC43147.1 response regulator [Rubellimicrobium rubrum]